MKESQSPHLKYDFDQIACQWAAAMPDGHFRQAIHHAAGWRPCERNKLEMAVLKLIEELRRKGGVA